MTTDPANEATLEPTVALTEIALTEIAPTVIARRKTAAREPAQRVTLAEILRITFCVLLVSVLGVGCQSSMASKMAPGERAIAMDALQEGARSGFATDFGSNQRNAVAPSSASAPNRQGDALARANAREGESSERTPPGQRLLIYRGTFTVMVPAVTESIDRWLSRVEAVGGYLQNRQGTSLVCRVPAAQFKSLVAEIPNFGRITFQSMTTEDVTREFYDVQIRLDTARKALARLQELLAKAEAVEDVLKIEKEIHRLTEKIERFEGQLRFMNDQIAFSTLSVTFQSNAPEVRTRPRKRSPFWWVQQVGVQPMRR